MPAVDVTPEELAALKAQKSGIAPAKGNPNGIAVPAGPPETFSPLEELDRKDAAFRSGVLPDLTPAEALAIKLKRDREFYDLSKWGPVVGEAASHLVGMGKDALKEQFTATEPLAGARAAGEGVLRANARLGQLLPDAWRGFAGVPLDIVSSALKNRGVLGAAKQAMSMDALKAMTATGLSPSVRAAMVFPQEGAEEIRKEMISDRDRLLEEQKLVEGKRSLLGEAVTAAVSDPIATALPWLPFETPQSLRPSTEFAEAAGKVAEPPASMKNTAEALGNLADVSWLVPFVKAGAVTGRAAQIAKASQAAALARGLARAEAIEIAKAAALRATAEEEAALARLGARSPASTSGPGPRGWVSPTIDAATPPPLPKPPIQPVPPRMFGAEQAGQAFAEAAKQASQKAPGVAQQVLGAAGRTAESLGKRVETWSEAAKSMLEKYDLPLSVASAGAGLVGAGPVGAVIGGAAPKAVKWATHLGKNASRWGSAMRAVAEADWATRMPVWRQIANNPNAPQWLVKGVTAPVYRKLVAGQLVEPALRGAAEVVKGTATGTAVGVGMVASDPDKTAEDLGGAIGGGLLLAGLGSVAAAPMAVKGRKADAFAYDAMRKASAEIQKGEDPLLIAQIPDRVMADAVTLEQVLNGKMPGRKGVTIDLMSEARFQAESPDPSGVAVYSEEGGRHRIMVNLEAVDADGRQLHEVGHAMFRTAAAATPAIVDHYRRMLGGSGLERAKADYQEGLYAGWQEGRKRWVAEGKDPNTYPAFQPIPRDDAFIVGELFSESLANLFRGEDLSEALPAMLGRTRTQTFFRDKDVVKALTDPATADLVRQQFESVRDYRPAVDAGAEPGIPLSSRDVANNHPAIPVETRPDGTRGNDFVEVLPGGRVQASPVPEVRRRVRNRRREVLGLFPDAEPVEGPAAPVPQGESNVTPRRTVSGTVLKTGTKLGDAFFNTARTFGDSTKDMLRRIEQAIETGETMAGWYQQIGSGDNWKGSVREHLGAIEAQYKDFIPFSFKVDKQGNLLIENYSLSALERKAARWAAGHGETSLDLWNGDLGTFRQDVQTYLRNHEANQPGDTGLGSAKRDVINAFLVGKNTAFEALNPLRSKLTGADRQGIVRSYRADRLQTVEPSDVQGFAKPQYEKQVKNLSPSTEPRSVTGHRYSPAVEEAATRQPNNDVRNLELAYTRAAGLPHRPWEGYAPVREDFAKRTADAYDKMVSRPDDPKVQAAYAAVARETLAQWKAATDAGYTFEVWDPGKGEPYKSSADMVRDVRDNKHLWFFPTQEGGFGGDNAAVQANTHPMLQPTGIISRGRNLNYVEVFRAVHDFFGHAKEGYQFGPRGEYNAYLAHSRMYSDEARPIVAANTHGQNSWVNFGAHLRRPDGSIPKKGEPGYVGVLDRPYAEQKVGFLPQDIVDEATGDIGRRLSLPVNESSAKFPAYEQTSAAAPRQEAAGPLRPQRYRVGLGSQRPAAATSFRDSLARAKREHPYGAGLDLKELEFYRDPATQLYLAEDRLAGAAVSSGQDLVSVFRLPESKARIDDILSEAAPNALTLDAFDAAGVLPNLYGKHGFRAVARVEFNPEYKPDGWDLAKLGTPDVVLMVRDPEGLTGLPAIERNYGDLKAAVPLVDYETASAMQAEAKQRVLAAQRRSSAAVPRELGPNRDFATPPTDEAARQSLDEGKRPAFGRARNLPEGTPVGLRIDIPAFKRTGNYVISVHNKAAGGKVGRIVGYDTVARVQDPTFFVSESGAERIAGGENKFPVATVEGSYLTDRTIPADIDQWTPVGMDPKEHSYFYDKATDQPVVGGSEAVSVGNTVFVKDPVYGQRENFRYSAKVNESEAFKKWFGDSKVVNPDGTPKVLYHGSVSRGVTQFDPELPAVRPRTGPDGIYFTSNLQTASTYARRPGTGSRERGEVIPAYVRMENPLDITKPIANGQRRGLSFGEAKRKALESYDPEIHDGYIFRGNGSNHDEYFVPDPTQIKSASDNVGTFDRENPDIRYSPAVNLREHGIELDGDMSMADSASLPLMGILKYKRVKDPVTGVVTKVPEVKKITAQAYDFLDSPLVQSIVAAEADPQATVKMLKSIKTKLNTSRLKSRNQLTPEESAFYEKVTDAYAERFVADYERIANDRDVVAAKGWYKDVAKFLAGRIPDANDRIMFLEFLGGTSPNTNVEQNFLYAIDLFNRWKLGEMEEYKKKFNAIAPQWEQGTVRRVDGSTVSGKVIENTALATVVQTADGGLVRVRGKDVAEFLPGSDEVRRRVFTDDGKSIRPEFLRDYTKALLEDYNGQATSATRALAKKSVAKLKANKDLSAGDYMQAYLTVEKAIPARKGGGRYGVHTDRVFSILNRNWVETTDAPKAVNFTENLAGLSTLATIDVWAARFLRRMGYDGFEKGPWRIQPMAEEGVANYDFFFGQDVFKKAGERIKERRGEALDGDDLQAIMWFAEKRYWAEKGWSKAEDLGDFRQYLYKMQPEAEGTYKLSNVQFSGTSPEFAQTLRVSMEDSRLSPSYYSRLTEKAIALNKRLSQGRDRWAEVLERNTSAFEGKMAKVEASSAPDKVKQKRQQLLAREYEKQLDTLEKVAARKRAKVVASRRDVERSLLEPYRQAK